MEERFELRITANPKALEFLRALAEEDDFRREVKNDPKGVLSERFGFDLPEVAHEVDLPPKGAVAELLAQASEPDEFGNVELMPTESWWLGMLFVLEAMVFVAGEDQEGDATD